MFFAERTKPYQLLAAMLAKEDNFKESFEYAERAKARVLLDAVRFGRNQQTAAMSAGEKVEENRLRGDVSALNAQISKLADKNNLADLQTKLDAARTALERFQTNLYATHPELRAKRGAVKPIEVGDVGSSLIKYVSFLIVFLSPTPDEKRSRRAYYLAKNNFLKIFSAAARSVLSSKRIFRFAPADQMTRKKFSSAKPICEPIRLFCEKAGRLNSASRFLFFIFEGKNFYETIDRELSAIGNFDLRRVVRHSAGGALRFSIAATRRRTAAANENR